MSVKRPTRIPFGVNVDVEAGTQPGGFGTPVIPGEVTFGVGSNYQIADVNFGGWTDPLVSVALYASQGASDVYCKPDEHDLLMGNVGVRIDFNSMNYPDKAMVTGWPGIEGSGMRYVTVYNFSTFSQNSVHVWGTKILNCEVV
tara:strand:+ start:3223 stop:3651 length:429 start_codon:yes stop_codon:yes gene_type:complete